MILNYNVPQLGKVTSELYDEAENCYNFLDYYPYVEKMKNIDQLGVIRGVHEGAHHSRWEYVMVQLSLIHQLSTLKDERTGRNIANGLGLQRKNNFSGSKISGAGIIQMWILLFNSGHLPGTFATEKGLLRYSMENLRFQEVIYEGLNNKTWHIFDKVCEDKDVYNFHKVLICFQLLRHKGSNTRFGNELIDLFLEVINYHFPGEDTKNRQSNLINLYNRIRQLSFLFLDSQYLSFPLNLDLSKIFFNFPYYINDLFKKHNSSILRTLDSFEDLLSINVYHSPEAISGLGIHSKNIEETTMNREINTITGLKKYLKNYNNFYPNFNELYDDKEIFHMLFEIDFTFSFINEYLIRKFRDYYSFKNEKKLNAKYGPSNCQLTYQSANKSKQIAVTLTVTKSRLDKNLRIIGKFLKDSINSNYHLKKDESDFIKNLIDDVTQRPYQDLFLSILNYVSDDNVSFEIKNESITKSIITINRALKHDINEIITVNKESNLIKSRKHEIKTLTHALIDLNYHSGWLVSLSPVGVYDEKGDPITDIDGCAIGFRNGKLGILLVEAKNQMRGSLSDAEAQLKERIKEIGFKTSASNEFIKIIGSSGKGVYSYITIDGRLNSEIS